MWDSGDFSEAGADDIVQDAAIDAIVEINPLSKGADAELKADLDTSEFTTIDFASDAGQDAVGDVAPPSEATEAEFKADLDTSEFATIDFASDADQETSREIDSSDKAADAELETKLDAAESAESDFASDVDRETPRENDSSDEAVDAELEAKLDAAESAEGDFASDADQEITEAEEKVEEDTGQEEVVEEEVETPENKDLVDEEQAEETETDLKFGELKPNSKYERNGHTYETDKLGRVEIISGELQLGEEVRTAHQTEVGKMGRENDEGGHWIGKRFKGSPDGVNLFPQDINLNRSDWKKMENEWATALEDGQEVETIMYAIYDDDGSRPIGMYVYDKMGSEEHERYFENAPHGAIKVEEE